MGTLQFKSGGGQIANFSNTPHGWIVASDADTTILLSSECRTMGELRARADYLKRLIDDAVVDAERNLPS